jgi:hypothetical protein
MDALLLTTTRNADHVALGTGGQRVIGCWDQITGYLERAFGPAHARLFAEPQVNAATGSTDWYGASEGEARPLRDLSAEDANLARARLGALLADLNSATERLRKSRRDEEKVLAEILALALIVPSEDSVWVLRRGPSDPESDPPWQPVLVGWGQTLNGQQPAPELLIGVAGTYRRPAGLAPMRIIGPPPPAPPPGRWPLWALIGALLLALLLFLLLLWRDPLGWFQVPPAQCVLAPDHWSRLNELRAAEAREVQLRQEIARIALELGNRRAACPPPPPAPLPPAPRSAQPAPTPPAAPPPRADLPEERWRQRDLSMLEGCWNLDSDYSIRNRVTGIVTRVRSWQMCFDRNGRGRQTLVYENGVRCDAPAVARFEQDTFVIDDTQDVQCDDRSRIFQRRAICRRVSDQRAQCDSVHVDQRISGRSIFFMRR